MAEDPKPPPPETEQVIEIKKKVREAFSVFDREGRNACDVREVGTIIRSLNIYPTEKQLQRWIHEVEEEEPTGFILYEKFESLMIRLLTEEASQHKRSSEDEIMAAFQTLDTDKKGYLDKDELQRLMKAYGEKFSDEEVKEMLTSAVDVDGKVHYEDFAELLAAD